MATSSKKRRVNLEEESEHISPLSKDHGDSESSEDEGKEEDFQSDDDSDNCAELNEEIQVEFEALPPQADDFFGIKRLLQQLFLKSKVNLSSLTDIILSQNHVGSVIKQSADQLAELELDSDESDDDDQNIFGFITVLNITTKKDDCIQEIKTLLEDRCAKCASASKKSEFSHMINNSSQNIGLLITERFVNIPPQLAPPLHRSLQKDLSAAAAKDGTFKFDYYVLISKTYKEADCDETGTKKKSKGTKIAESEELMFANAEDEYYHQESLMSFDYPVTDESDTVIAGKWSFEDAEMRTYRTVMIVPASKMPNILSQIDDNLTI